jgi:hypothetical protein
VAYKTFTGDLFARNNPVWTDTGLLAPGKTGPRVLNNRQAREAAFDVLKAVVSGKGLDSFATTAKKVPERPQQEAALELEL